MAKRVPIHPHIRGAKPGPKSKSKPRPKLTPPDAIFTRDTNPRRVPDAIRDAADLWLDMFMHLSSLTAAERPESISPLTEVNDYNQRIWINSTAQLADYALELYENRWPHESHKGVSGRD